jgi:hypothetical protein
MKLPITMLEVSPLDGDCSNQYKLAIQAKNVLAHRILDLNPRFRAQVIDPPQDLSHHIGMNIGLTDQQGIPLVHSMNIERIRTFLQTEFLRVSPTQNVVETEFGIDIGEQWTRLKEQLVFQALLSIQLPFRRALGQALLAQSILGQQSCALEKAGLHEVVPAAEEALRHLYIRITGSSIGFGE